MPRIRTFVAVELNAAVRAGARRLIGRLGVTSAQVGWVAEENLHWTLDFLGEVEQNLAADACRAVCEAVAPLDPFEVAARGAGAFPTPARPRTIWLGAAEGEGPLTALHDALGRALRPLGIRGEGRRFHPHVTLGRVRRAGPGIGELAALVEKHAAFDAGRMTVSQAVVFSSQLQSSGPVYTPLGRAKLGGGK